MRNVFREGWFYGVSIAAIILAALWFHDPANKPWQYDYLFHISSFLLIAYAGHKMELPRPAIYLVALSLALGWEGYETLLPYEGFAGDWIDDMMANTVGVFFVDLQMLHKQKFTFVTTPKP